MTNKLTLLASVVAASTAMMATSASAAESTLDKVTSQGFLTCGVSTGLKGSLTLTQKVNGKESMLSIVKRLQRLYSVTRLKLSMYL